MQNPERARSAFHCDQGARFDAGLITSVPSNWVVAETGDINADGKADIAWQAMTSGTIVVYFMASSTVAGS